jgi:hypothetical protein
MTVCDTFWDVRCVCRFMLVYYISKYVLYMEYEGNDDAVCVTPPFFLGRPLERLVCRFISVHYLLIYAL